MSLEFTVEIWEALRSHVDSHERKDAAETLVNLLIENNYEAADIKESFRGDKDVLTALKYFVDQQDGDEDYEDYDDEYEDNEYEE